SNGHRYGYNGHEKDDEIAGEGNHLDFGGFGYDPRTGMRRNREPLAEKYPHLSGYAGFMNNPIYYNDPTGYEGDTPLEPAPQASGGSFWGGVGNFFSGLGN